MHPVLLLQLDLAWHDAAANHAMIAAALERAQPAPGTLVVGPEMAASGFTMDVATAAEGEEDGATLHLTRRLAQRYGVTLVLGRVVQPDDRGRNEAVAAGPDGRVLGRYWKMHPFRFAGETDHYAPGDRVAVIDWGDVRVGLFICYDLRFPELFRAAALRHRAEVLVVIANWPTPRLAHWIALLRARAIENQCYVVGVNRTGNDPKNAYPGRSVVIDPRGLTTADAGPDAGEVPAALDLPALRKYRADFPAMQDARGDLLA